MCVCSKIYEGKTYRGAVKLVIIFRGSVRPNESYGVAKNMFDCSAAHDNNYR